MTGKLSRPFVALALAVAAAFVGAPLVAGGAQQLPPGITLPPKASETTTSSSTSSSTTAPPQTSSTAAPTTTAKPAPGPLDGKPGAPGAGAGGSPTTTAPTSTTGPTTTTSSTTTTARQPSPTTTAQQPGATTRAPLPATTHPTTPPPSLSAGQVDAVLRDQQRSGASSTAALVDALRPLLNLGMTLEEALTLGMGRFPVLGVANWTDDWLDPRVGPPPHQHQGNDIFAAFDVPVRAPVDGVVRFEDGGLGGKGAFVTAADGTYYYMAHLNGFSRDLTSGSPVTQGQIVGYNGDSGNAKGGAPHVHFEIHPGGGAAINPKPILDAWVAEALAKVPDLIASFTPKPAEGATATATDAGEGPPPILMTTGLTRRFSVPTGPPPGRRDRDRAADFNRAVLAPVTPSALAPLLEQG